jgi:hypothetical protein
MPVQKYSCFGGLRGRNTPVCRSPGQKCRAFGPPGGVYVALFSPAGRSMPRAFGSPNGRNS